MQNQKCNLIDTGPNKYYFEPGSKSQCFGLDWSGIWGQGEQEECNSCVLLSFYLCWDTSVTLSVLSSDSEIYTEYFENIRNMCRVWLYSLPQLNWSYRKTKYGSHTFLCFEAFHKTRQKQTTSRWVIILISCQWKSKWYFRLSRKDTINQ